MNMVKSDKCPQIMQHHIMYVDSTEVSFARVLSFAGA